MTQDDKDFLYYQALEKDTLSVSPRFTNKQYGVNGEVIEKHIRGVSMKFGDSPNHKMTKRIETTDGIEIHLKATDNKQQEIKAYFYEDTRNIKTLTVQRWMVKTGNAHKESMVLYGEQLDLLLKFVQSLKGIPLNGKGKVSIPLDNALSRINEPNITDENVLKYLKDNPTLINKIVENDLTENDVVSIGYRKKQLQIFKTMLTDDELKESDWQNFFEKNSWIFGYGLSYVFSTNLDDKKLEQVVSGFDFNNSGKRVDGLLKTAGFINSLCFVEIKTHKTPLLKKEYRAGCWNISDEFSGAITQIQNTVYLANKKIQDSVKIKDNEGYLSGEEIFNYNPKAYLVIGKLDEFTKNQEVHYDKYCSFELFRKNINSPEIITFDELYERAKFIVEVKNT